MESRSKIFGHPIHPVLVTLPVGLFITAVVCDIIYLITRNTFFNVVAYYDIIIGIIGGLTAAIFGFRDWLALPHGTRARRIGGMHGIGNVILVVLFLVTWLLRMPNANFTPTTLALVFSFGGILLGLLTAWLGGEMVYRLGVASDEGANLNAPSSLSGRATMGMAPSGMMRGGPSIVPVTGEKDRDEDDTEDKTSR
jgi:uncharacterized membrane protein